MLFERAECSFLFPECILKAFVQRHKFTFASFLKSLSLEFDDFDDFRKHKVGFSLELFSFATFHLR